MASDDVSVTTAHEALRNHFADADVPESAAADLVRLVHGVLPARTDPAAVRSAAAEPDAGRGAAGRGAAGNPAAGSTAAGSTAAGGTAAGGTAAGSTAAGSTAAGGTAAGDAAAGGTADAVTLLSALRLLRELRDELAGWEPLLIDAARGLGVSWNDLAPALGVASRQAAERRYLRLRPARADEAGSTRDERVRNERNRRAEDRAVVDWARRHGATLRRIAGRVADLDGQTELDEPTRRSVDHVQRTLGENDSAALLGPLRAARDTLGTSHPSLARSISDLIAHADSLRDDTRQRRADDRAPSAP